MKVADYIIDFFAQKGIDKAFVVYGAANGDLIDAFTRNNKIQYVSTMHEQAAGFAAEGYAKIKRLPGLSIVTSGPGATNLVTSVANCFYESIPCIFISGQINSKFLRPDKSLRQVGFQETDVVSTVKHITKYAKMITSPNEIRYELEKSYSLCNSGRKGPVFLDIPLDIQKANIKIGKLKSIGKNFNKPVFNLKKARTSIRKYLPSRTRKSVEWSRNTRRIDRKIWNAQQSRVFQKTVSKENIYDDPPGRRSCLACIFTTGYNAEKHSSKDGSNISSSR